MTGTPRADERRHLERVQADLQREFASLPIEVVHGRFAELVADFDAAPVRTFVPVLVQRRARESLRQLV